MQKCQKSKNTLVKILFYAEAILILDWLKDFLKIYTWIELWIIVSIPAVMACFWLLFSFMLSLQNEAIRAAAIWLLVSGLTAGAATVDALKKQKG
jgi:hypothetical protein